MQLLGLGFFLGFVLGYIEYSILTGFDIYKQVMFQLQLVSALALIYFAKWQYEFKRREHLDPKFKVHNPHFFHGWKRERSADEEEIEITGVKFLGKLQNEGPGNARNVVLESIKLEVAASGDNWGKMGLTESLEVNKEMSPRMKDGEKSRFIVDISEMIIAEDKTLVKMITGDEKLEISGGKITILSDKGRQEVDILDIDKGSREGIYADDVNAMAPLS